MAGRIGDDTPGATVAIVDGDSPLLTKGYGSADVDADIPVRTEETTFRVGSVGKLVTWTAVAQSVEQGVLDLDEDVNYYLEDSSVSVPETDDEPITLRHLGTHTAGFESALDPAVVDDPDALAPLETVLTTDQPARVRQPGELVGYSNYGAALAGHVVAEVHDTTFEKYVRSNVFEPLGMTHSTFAQPVSDDHPGTLAAGHTRDGSAFTPAETVLINMRPAGSMSATAGDMAAFMSAHLGDGAVADERILETDTVRTMHELHHVRHPAVTNWRYGFHEYGDPDADFIGHSGATINFTSHLVLALEHGVGLFVNYNTNDQRSDTPADVIDELIAEYGLGSATETSNSTPQPGSTPKPGSRERADAVAGEYGVSFLPRSGPLQIVDLLERVSVEPAGNGRISTGSLDGDTRQWFETEPYVFRDVDGRDAIAFEVGDDGVAAMHMSNEPTGVYQPVPLHERQLVSGGVVGASLAGFALSLVGWGVTGARRRWGGPVDGDESGTEGSE